MHNIADGIVVCSCIPYAWGPAGRDSRSAIVARPSLLEDRGRDCFKMRTCDASLLMPRRRGTVAAGDVETTDVDVVTAVVPDRVAEPTIFRAPLCVGDIVDAGAGGTAAFVVIVPEG